VAILGRLERSQRQRQTLNRQRLRAYGTTCPAGDLQQGPVQVLGLHQHPALEPWTGVRKERIREAVVAFVRQGIRLDRRAEEADAELAPDRVVSVPAVIE